MNAIACRRYGPLEVTRFKENERPASGDRPARLTRQPVSDVPYGAIVALDLLRKADIQYGQRVLINGASSEIGSAAVQIAKHYFGAEVTGVCPAHELELVKSLGADKVIDYTKEDFTRNGQTYDLIIDVSGKSSFSRCKKALKPDGRYLPAGFKTGQLFQMLWTSMFCNKRVICAMGAGNNKDLTFIEKLVKAGKLKPVHLD